MRFEVLERLPSPERKPKVFHEWIAKRIRKNQNCILVFNGATGSGKSYACLDLASDLSLMFDTPFTIRNNLSFNFRDLLIKMQQSNYKPGTVYVMEEIGSIGSGASSREWQSEVNKFFFSFLQTARAFNQILILNCPSFSYLEKGSRELVHAQLEALGVNPQNKKSYFKPFIIQCNRRTGKLYFKYLRYMFDGQLRKVKVMKFKLPPENLIEEYEISKRKFLMELTDKIIMRDKESITSIQQQEKQMLGLLKSGMTSQAIAQELHITQRAVQKALCRLRGKGYHITHKRQGKAIIGYIVTEPSESKANPAAV